MKFTTLKVVRIEKFGAFVNLFDKTDALVHIQNGLDAYQ